LVVVLVVDVDVDEKLSNAGSQVLLTIRTLANIFVHVHDTRPRALNPAESCSPKGEGLRPGTIAKFLGREISFALAGALF
jgi:hypothetical protein